MAKITAGTINLEVTYSELEVIRRALLLVDAFGKHDDEQPARELLADIGNTSE